MVATAFSRTSIGSMHSTWLCARFQLVCRVEVEQVRLPTRIAIT